MGLFDKTKTAYYSSSTLMYGEVKGIIPQTVISATARNLDIGEALIDNLINGVLTNAASMYNFGKQTEDGNEGYHLGLPYGTKSYMSNVRESTIKLLIQREVGFNILINSFSFDKDSAQHYAWEYIQSNYGWVFGLNDVPNPPFDSGGVDVDYYEAAVLADNSIRITYGYGSLYHYEDVVVPDLIKGDLYYYVTYKKLDGKGNPTGELLYWNYREKAGTNPELSVDTNNQDLVSPYYPVVPLRENKVNLNDEDTRNEAEYLSSRQCLNFINIDIDDTIKAINESPDIDNIDHAYIMLGIDMTTDKQNSKRYIYEFFEDLATTARVSQGDFEYWFANDQDTSTPPVNMVAIADAKFRTEIIWNYIEKTTTVGFIEGLEVGEVIVYNPGSVAILNGNFAYESNQSSIVIRKQIAETTYVTLHIVGLTHISYAYDDNTVKTTIEQAFEEDAPEGTFVIPLNYVIARDMGVLVAHDMIYDAVRIVFNSKIVTKLKWYETGIFKVGLVIIIIVYSVVTGNYVNGFNWLQALAIAGTTTLNLIISNIVIGVVTKVARDLLGEELALVLALVAASQGLTISMEGVSFAASLSPIEIYGVITQGISGVSNLYIANEIGDLKDEAKEIDEERKQFEEEYKDNISDPSNLQGLGAEYSYTYDVVKDSPSYYYTRTIHSGFINTIDIIGPEYYVDGLLKLDLPYSPIRTRTT